MNRFIRRQDGALTTFGLFLTVTMLIVGGLAIDVANAVMVRTQLQVAADSAAHAALVAREYKTESEAKAIAVAVAQGALPQGKFGDTIGANDITFGQWDAANDRFVIVPGSDDAVLVSTQRMQSRNNGVVTFFLRFVGLTNLDLKTESVFETYYPTCFREGFVAQDRVDVQSNNLYKAGFCIHSNDHVEVNNNNEFEDGVIVSMPFETDIVMPSSGWSKNPGLQKALRSGSYRIRILQRIDDIIAGFDDPNSDYFRSDYLNLPVQTVPMNVPKKFDNSVWQAGKVHDVTCPGNKKLSIPANTTLRHGAIVTNCVVQIGSGVELQDVLIISTNTDIAAIDGASGVVLGDNDGCTAGGGVQIVTKGGVNFPAKLEIYGSQIIAAKKIDFEANANGIEGVSMVSGGELDSTSNMEMGFCNGAGMENRFEAEYFRMAR